MEGFRQIGQCVEEVGGWCINIARRYKFFQFPNLSQVSYAVYNSIDEFQKVVGITRESSPSPVRTGYDTLEGQFFVLLR